MGRTVWIWRIRGMRVGPAGAGVRKAAGGARTGLGPERSRVDWVEAARENARAAAVRKEKRRRNVEGK